ncbi:ROK family protein [Virgibacillus siamensis]|uniref:ROK family protein n=1 Tax=Virgibacillus siamensis TaxID=480071 RepID=UPI0009852B2F|nr:ROK family protein [Virgibacillus siamensis]
MRYAIGIDIGGTKISSGIVNEAGDLIQQETVSSDPSDKESMFGRVLKCVEQLMDHSSISVHDIYGVGAGVPGKVDWDNGIAVYQNNLPWENFPFVKRLRDKLGFERIVMDNDVYMAAFAEWRNAELHAGETFVYVTISTGISSSIMQDGEFLRGAGFAGEIGLIPVVASRNGNGWERLEKVASGPALEKRARQLYQDDQMTTKDIFTAYYRGDASAKQLVEDAGSSIAQAVYIINSVIDPHKIVFGGSVIAHNPVLLDIIKQKLKRYLLAEQMHILDAMEVSQLGSGQGVIGAGLSVFQQSNVRVMG